jgi:diaminopimelate epimerase
MGTKIKFTKMHGLGNDYIYVYCGDNLYFDPCKVSRILSRRHFSVGSDGLVLMCSSSVADIKMRMFNADGSEGGMCGNAVRCVGKYLYDRGIVNKKEISVETLSGLKYLTLTVGKNGKVEFVSADMGKANFNPKAVPSLFEKEAIDTELEVGGKVYKVTALSTGSSHCVTFSDDVFNLVLDEIGPLFEKHPMFPMGVNTEFVECVDRTHINMRVWERGSGETLACGTGACAVVATAVKLGLCDANVPVTVSLRGGNMEIICSDDFSLTMNGTAETVFDGEIEVEI